MDVVKAALDLELVMMSIKSSKYIRCLLLQFAQFQYWTAVQHPAMDLIKRFPKNLLEEDGEISLSLLCHAAMVHGVHYDQSHLPDLFKLTHVHLQTAAEITMDLGIRVSRKHHRRVSAQDREVTTLVAHFSAVLGRLGDGSWLHYPTRPRKTLQYEPRLYMLSRLVNSSQARLRPADFRGEIRQAFLDIRRLLIDTNTAIWIPDGGLSSSEMSSESEGFFDVQLSSDDDDDDDDDDEDDDLFEDELFPTEISRGTDPSSSEEEEEILINHHRQRQRGANTSNGSNSRESLSTISSHSVYDREFSILAIRERRKRRKILPDGTQKTMFEYRVRWRNFPESDQETWEPEANLMEDCPLLLYDFCQNLLNSS